MLFPALFALGGAFFFFVLRVQGADGCFPKPLSPEKEAELLQKMQQDHDEKAREQLIEHNLRLVAHIVKKYYASSAEQDDLISIGTIGLIKAVSTFRPDKNMRLATYASKCIQNELLRERSKPDELTNFLEEVRQRCRFRYHFFGHYHGDGIIQKQFVLLYKQIVRLK